MSSPIDKKTLEYLAKLARLDLKPKEEEKLLKDLQKILDYFEELKEVDTKDAEAVAGGAELKNVFRGDGERENTNQGEGIGAFPESEKGFLKIPPVFE
jgi:aspartyl-tRNA(Asn)/glutamyl-tRNA(Gln) amidotransferase subunit C